MFYQSQSDLLYSCFIHAIAVQITKGRIVSDFNFDEWLQLAKSDPEAFEKRRQQAIDALIATASGEQQHRLRGLQWRIDMERRKYKNPLVRCQKVFSMMWASVYSDNGLLQALQGRTAAQANKADGRTERASILEFQQATD